MPRRRKHITAGDEPMIGRRLAILRNRRGMTQVELASRLDMSQPLLSRYERGELRLHGALVADLAKALGVSSDEVLGLKEPKKQDALKDRRLLRLVQQIDILPKREKHTLIKTIDNYLKGSRIA